MNPQNSRQADDREYAVEAIKADLRSLIRTAEYAEHCGVTVNDIAGEICSTDKVFSSSLRNILRKRSLPAEIAGRTEGLTLATRVSQRKASQVSITFTTTNVIFGSEAARKNASLCLVEYIILKREPVHHLWAYVILPKFEVKSKTPDEQFRNYVSKVKRMLADHGIHVHTIKDKYSDGMAEFEGIDDAVASNILDIRKTYDNAVSRYNEGDTQGAISELSEMTKGVGNHWYTFTDAYMGLASWIYEVNFEGVQKSVINRCVAFLQWYAKRLQLGTSKIQHLVQKKLLSSQASDVGDSIAEESERAKKLLTLLIDRQPLTRDELDYEDTVKTMMGFSEKLSTVNKESEREVERGTVGETVKLLCKRNRVLSDLVDYGRNMLDKLLEAKGQREKCSPMQIQDMHEDIYWLVGDVMAEIKDYCEFELSKGNKLERLQCCLQSRLRKKLKLWA